MTASIWTVTVSPTKQIVRNKIKNTNKVTSGNISLMIKTIFKTNIINGDCQM